jgi:RNA polymerase sigma-70 factor (ECF subfamily)
MSPAARDVSNREPGWVLEALRRYEGPLLRYAASLAGEARAADVVQDTFLRLCARRAGDLEEHLAGWLFTVCKNRALELRRSERRLTPIEEDDMPPSPDSGPAAKLELKESLSRVGAAMAALSERHREALLLKIDGGLSYKEIAAVMNLSVGNVGFILHAAIAAIKEHLARHDAPSRRETGGMP